jgi:hypothetical protein
MDTTNSTPELHRLPCDGTDAPSPPAVECPIIVSGLARSGTTWMQWFLSQHPRIHIHGQTPNLPWGEWWQWYQRLVLQGQWAERSNSHHGYEIAHYAGIFRRAFRDYMTGNGPQKPRWGLKLVNLACSREAVWQVVSFWPEVRWVICIRDPFMTIASTKNTFAPELDLQSRAAAWVEVCKFASTCDAGRLVTVPIDQLDRQSPAQREQALRRVLECVGEGPCDETNQFIREWPRVHKVKPDEQRTFELSQEQKHQLIAEVPELSEWMAKLGYLPGSRMQGEASWNG